MQKISLKTWIAFLILFLTVVFYFLFFGGDLPFNESEKEIDYRAPKTMISTQLEPTLVRPGEEARAVIEIKMLDGFHIYSVVPSDEEDVPPPTSIQWEATSLELKGPVYETAPTIQMDKVIGVTLAYHEESVRLYQNLKIPDDFSLGKISQKGEIKYQACNDRVCLPTKKEEITVSFNVEPGKVRKEHTIMNRYIDEVMEEDEFLPDSDSLEGALSQGVFSFILLAAIMGLIAWFTPCVFPMIPITVSYFAGRAEDSKKQLFLLASVFSLGIIVTYTGAGLLLTAFMGVASVAQLATNPWVNLAIALLFAVFAFNFMGFYEFRLPAALVQNADNLSRRGNGFIAVSLMGIVFTLTAFTCTAPFVGTLLIAAASGEWAWPVLGMLVFSSVFAFPFFLLAIFPKLINRFKSNSIGWMVDLKVILGLIELMAVLKFVSNADLVWQWGFFDRIAVLLGWAVLTLIMAFILLKHLIKIKKSEKSWKRMEVLTKNHPFPWAFSLLFIFISLYFVYGSTGKTLDGWTESYLPPEIFKTSSRRPITVEGKIKPIETVHELPWNLTLEAALEEAKTANKPIFVDFTGYTCVNCRWMEKNVFAEEEVFEKLKNNFVLAQLFTDGGDGWEDKQKLQIDRFHTIALPFYVILSPQDNVLAKKTGMLSKKEFLAFLSQGKTN